LWEKRTGPRKGIAALPEFSEPFRHGKKKPVQELSASALKEAKRLAEKERELFAVYGYPNINHGVEKKYFDCMLNNEEFLKHSI